MIKKSLMLRGAVLTGVLLAATIAVGGSASAEGGWGPRNIEAASAAIPAQAGDTVGDVSQHVDRLGRRTIRASAVATSSAVCDGCTATAVTMQVIYARSIRSMRIDNVAAAWSACTGCRASALSLQVVITRKAGDITAGNRALAVNATCLDCRTASAAVQIVVVSPSNRELSQSDLSEIESLRGQLEAQLAAQLVSPPTHAQLAPRAAQRQILASTAGQIEARVTKMLGGSAHHDIQVQQGS